MIQITSFVGSHKYRELSDLSIEVRVLLSTYHLLSCSHSPHPPPPLPPPPPSPPSSPPPSLPPSLQGVLPFENLAESSNKCDDLMRDMQLDDVVQGHSQC